MEAENSKATYAYLYRKLHKNAHYLLDLKPTHFRCLQLRT